MTEYPECRNSDILLRQQILRDFYPEKVKIIDGKEAILFRDEYLVPTQDNVKRLRAFIQNTEGRLPPTTWEVAKQRGINKEIWESSIVLKKVDLRT